VRDAIVPELNARYGVYVRGKSGDWHFSMENFVQYPRAGGSIGRARRQRRARRAAQDLDAMAKAWSQLEPLRQLRLCATKCA
jgi:hypothetical protein